MTEAEFTKKMKVIGWTDEEILEKINRYKKWAEIFLIDSFPPPPLEEYLVPKPQNQENGIYTNYGLNYKNK